MTGPITTFTSPSGQVMRWSIAGGPGVPLLLINGLGGNIEMWGPFRDALGERPTLAFDAPGTGLSSTPWRPPSIHLVVGQIVQALDQFGVDVVDVLGYSFGGVVAQELARRHPDRLRRLVLAATTPGRGAPMPSPLAVANLMTPARYYLPPAVDFLNMAALGDGEGTATFTRLNRARRRHPPTLFGYWWQLMAIAGWRGGDWLDELDLPCLIVAGENDRVAGPDVARVLAHAIRTSRLAIAADAGHLLLYSDTPHAVVEEIVQFLDVVEIGEAQRDLTFVST